MTIVLVFYAALRQSGVLKQPFAQWLVFVVGLLVPSTILVAENGALYACSRKSK